LVHHALQLWRSRAPNQIQRAAPAMVPSPRRNEDARSRIPLVQNATEDCIMGRYLLLRLLGIPLPILVLIWLFGGLH